jgi:hypothetical protein
MRYFLFYLGYAAVLFALAFTAKNMSKIPDGMFQKTDTTKPWVDPELKPYVDQYLQDMEDMGMPISRYKKIDSIILLPDTAIACTDGALGCANNRLVFIKRPSGGYLIDTNMYYTFLVYHEMGHAMYNLPHNNFRLSIMNEAPVLNMREYRMLWDKFKLEYQSFALAGLAIGAFEW